MTDYNLGECQDVVGSTSCKLSDARINALRSGGGSGRYRYKATTLGYTTFWGGDCVYATTSAATGSCGRCSVNLDLSGATDFSHGGAYGIQCQHPQGNFLSNYVGSELRRYVINGNHHSDRQDSFLNMQVWVR